MFCFMIVSAIQILEIMYCYSGLDYHMAKKCLEHLRKLARAGHNIVCTLHQPSASLLDQLDHVYVVAEGWCVYQGSTNGLTNFLEDMSLPCPKYHNPADHGKSPHCLLS